MAAEAQTRRWGGGEPSDKPLRAWLEYVVETALDWLDALDAPAEDLEDDELSGEEPAV